MYIYIRPSDYSLFNKTYRQFIKNHSNENLTKEQIETYKRALILQQTIKTTVIAIKNDYNTILTISNSTGNFKKDLNNLKHFIKRNHYEIIDELGNLYTWPEFLKII